MRVFLEKVARAGFLRRISRPVSPRFELANVAHALEGYPVLFEAVEGFPDWQVLSGSCSDRRYMAMALGVSPGHLLAHLANAIANPELPPVQDSGKCQEVVETDVQLNKIPILHHLQQDAGAYLTSAVVIVSDPDTGRNMAYHRMLRLGERELVARLVENRGTETAWQKTAGDLPCAICIGLPLQVNLAAAIAPRPGVDELGIAHALADTPLVRCQSNDLEVPVDAELVLEGRITKRLVSEGPFPDLTETMDHVRQQPVVEIDCITHRRAPIYHALLPGGLEHKLLMGMPREPTIFEQVNKVVHCRDVLITPGGASWLHAVVQIDKQGPEDGKHALEAAFRGHGSLKHVIVVDVDVDIHDPHQVEWAIATRFQASRDLMVFPDRPGSSLDPSGIQVAGKKARTAKMGLDATVPWGADPRGFQRVRYDPIRLSEYLKEG